LLLTVAVALPTLVHADTVKGGREYMIEQREIMKAKKQMVNDEREVEEFTNYLVEIDQLRLPRRFDDFWPMNRDVRVAMSRECEQSANERLKSVMLESQGLQYIVADGDMDAYRRYRHLLGEFLPLMREDLETVAEEIRHRESEWE
jgi:hypothetical protein